MMSTKAKMLWFSIVFLLFVTNPVKAANDSTDFRFGFKVGSGITYLTHHHLYMLGKSKVTFTLGFLGEYHLNDWLAARMSVEYTHKGGGFLDPRILYAKDDPMMGIPQLHKTLYATNLTIHTIEIPVTAKFMFPVKSNTLRPFFVAGPSFGYNFHARADNYYLWEFDQAPNDLLDETSDFVTDKIKSWNISVYSGIGTEIHTSKRLIYEIGLNFRLGMTYEDDFFYTLYHKYSSISTLVYIALKF